MVDTYAAHTHANQNKAEIERSADCGCFTCYAVFPAQTVIRWTDTTAWCPQCEMHGCVIADASGLPLEQAYLEAAHDHWIGPLDWLDAQAAETHRIATALYRTKSEPAPQKRPWWKFW